MFLIVRQDALQVSYCVGQKDHSGFFCNILPKNPNELFGQPNTLQGTRGSSPRVSEPQPPSPKPQSNSLPVFLNKVLLEHGLAQSHIIGGYFCITVITVVSLYTREALNTC